MPHRSDRADGRMPQFRPPSVHAAARTPPPEGGGAGAAVEQPCGYAHDPAVPCCVCHTDWTAP